MITAIYCDYSDMAEGVGFEPTFAFAKTVFKTVAIVHSATPPQTVLVYEIDLSLANHDLL
jgi:hypothetical protein